MAKYSGSYERIVLGVSQQVPQDRREGQHFEQVNFVSDPVRGLVRRRGSEFINEAPVKGRNLNSMFSDEAAKYRTYDFIVDKSRYSLIYRVDKQGDNITQGYSTQWCYCWDKDNNKFLDVVFSDGGDWYRPGDQTPDPEDPLVTKLRSNGSPSITNVGRYIYIAVNDHEPTYSVNDVWGSDENYGSAVVWIRNGGYSKRFKVTLTVRDKSTDQLVELVGEYTTLQASYPGLLDTTDILFDDPEYQKKINDRTNEYNSEVTAWIGKAAADIEPENIANMIIESLEGSRNDKSISSADISFERSNSSIGIIVDTDKYIIEELETTDSGDETFIRGSANIVSSTDKLTAEHYPGKIVKIQAKRSDEADAYYMKAEPRTSLGGSGMTEVTWVQTAGTVVSIDSAFVFGTIENDVLYIAGSAEKLNEISGMTDDVPTFQDSSAGDLISSPIPFFLGRRIDFLGNFQDRLIIGSGSTMLFSRTGRYLNFFRQDAMSVLDDDPIEIYPTGSEDDTVRAGVMFQKSMILFGDRKQYLLNGNTALSPRTALMPIVGAHEDTVDASPVASGNFIFHAKWRNGITSAHQLQGGYVADTPESFEISKQLSNYMKGKPLEILPITTPDSLIIRTDNNLNELFIYNYMDAQGGAERIFDSWSRWRWDSGLGSCIGITYDRGDIVVFTLRRRWTVSTFGSWNIVADRFSLSGDISDKPYLDSMMKLRDVENPLNGYQWNGFLPDDEPVNDMYVAFDDTSDYRLMGQTWDTRQALIDSYPSEYESLWAGVGFDAYVTPTNPYIRDRNQKAIVNGRTVISQFIVSLADTAGVMFEVTPKGGTPVIKGDYNGRELSRSTAELGIQPVAKEAEVPFIVGMENTQFTYTIRSRNWLPLTVVGVTWVGQLFSNTRRA